MKKSLLPITALMLIAWGQASSQVPSACQGIVPISSCRGDRACITQAQQQQAVCRASQDVGNRPVVSVPEPATALLFGSALVGLALARKGKGKPIIVSSAPTR